MIFLASGSFKQICTRRSTSATHSGEILLSLMLTGPQLLMFSKPSSLAHGLSSSGVPNGLSAANAGPAAPRMIATTPTNRPRMCRLLEESERHRRSDAANCQRVAELGNERELEI